MGHPHRRRRYNTVPFFQICPQLAKRETRSFQILSGDGLALPVGEYGLLENYCTEPDCDCQRVLLTVIRRSASQVEATISWGFDPTHEMFEPYLDPILPQGAHAAEILDFVEGMIAGDPAYLERLKRHYAITKQIVAGQLRAEDAPTSQVIQGLQPVDPGFLQKTPRETGRHRPQEAAAPEFLNRAERRARMKGPRRKH